MKLVKEYLKMVSGQLSPRKIAPRLRLGFGLGLVLSLWGAGGFSSGAIVLEPLKIMLFTEVVVWGCSQIGVQNSKNLL